MDVGWKEKGERERERERGYEGGREREKRIEFVICFHCDNTITYVHMRMYV